MIACIFVNLPEVAKIKLKIKIYEKRAKNGMQLFQPSTFLFWCVDIITLQHTFVKAISINQCDWNWLYILVKDFKPSLLAISCHEQESSLDSVLTSAVLQWNSWTKTGSYLNQMSSSDKEKDVCMYMETTKCVGIYQIFWVNNNLNF